MRYNGIIKNDTANGTGFHVSFFVQGCPHRCKGCFNPETWDFNGGAPYTDDVKEEIISAIGANGVQRNLSILGGEPLASENLYMVSDLIKAVKEAYPNIKIYLWTGYYMEQLNKDNTYINYILNNLTYLIDGPFIEEQKNLNLELRGSDNQRIWYHADENLWKKK